MWNAWMDEAQAGIKIAGRNLNNLRYAVGTTLMAESEEELKPPDEGDQKNSGTEFSSRWKKNSPIKDSVEGKNKKSSCFVIIIVIIILLHKISLCNAHLPSTLTSFLAL